MAFNQLVLPLGNSNNLTESNQTYHERLIRLLCEDLDFHGQDSGYASHDFHSFPAKFPPQLPRKFILELTNPGDSVLDPMMGSGTTVVEAFLSGRYGIGFDIDPLALRISQVKVTPLDPEKIFKIGDTLLAEATFAINGKRKELETTLESKWDRDTTKFLNYWFARETQIELLALITEIEKISDPRWVKSNPILNMEMHRIYPSMTPAQI